jgi:hypothetical protein
MDNGTNEMSASEGSGQTAGDDPVKAWYRSRTVWGALIAVFASVLHAFGIDLGTDAQGQIADAAVTLAGTFGGLLALYGRLKADTTVRVI